MPNETKPDKPTPNPNPTSIRSMISLPVIPVTTANEDATLIEPGATNMSQKAMKVKDIITSSKNPILSTLTNSRTIKNGSKIPICK